MGFCASAALLPFDIGVEREGTDREIVDKGKFEIRRRVADGTFEQTARDRAAVRRDHGGVRTDDLRRGLTLLNTERSKTNSETAGQERRDGQLRDLAVHLGKVAGEDPLEGPGLDGDETQRCLDSAGPQLAPVEDLGAEAR